MEQGLSQHEALLKQRHFGKNEIVTKSTHTALSIFFSQFPTFLNITLFAAGAFSLAIGHFLDGFFIIAVILLNAVFGFIQEYRAEKSLEKLKNYTVQSVRVKRGGKEHEIEATSLVPDDILIISEGDRIPADCTVIDSNRLEVEESVLTGESLPVLKQNNDEIFSGTLVAKGNALAKVTAIGMSTKFGQIAQTLETIKTEPTPLQKNLSDLGKTLTIAIIIIATAIIPIGIYHGEQAVPIILTAVSIAVAAIPQGLPAVITIALAIGTNRMAKRRAIVRSMPSIETLGAVQIILVDKTGTLTENAMQVKKTWIHDDKNLGSILKACVLGNTASLVEQENGKFEIVGDKTDGALLVYAKKEEHTNFIDVSHGKILDEHVFDAKTRMITVVWEKDGKKHVFVRGAPEAVLEKSNISGKLRKEAIDMYETFANQGLRVIAFGTKIDPDAQQKKRHELESDLLFLGIIGIYDPPREEVKQAILEAKHAGIKTVMVTGDNKLTAVAIAKEIGLLEEGDDVITGEDLEKMTDEELSKLLPHVRIFARAKPHDKLRITTLLKKQGYIVGVTGDGVNDALALRKADVGVAMGKTGTDVAKEASDIIIADDNFTTFVKAIEEGRTIYRNILTAITYLLTGNLSEIALVFFGTLLGLPAPLLPTQILWINLVTDVFPAMALASDTKHPDILKQKPRDPHEPLLNRTRLTFIAVVGLGLSFSLLGIFMMLLVFFSEIEARSLIFNAIIVSHMGLAFVVRRQSFLRINKFLLISVICIILAQIVITSLPIFQEIFGI